jgi:integrase
MPLLVAVRSANGGVTVVEGEPKELSPEFKAYVGRRRAASAGTYAYIKKLARMRCSQISFAEIAAFKTQMFNDGLSESTIQKEIALLKVFFNTTKLMNWKGLENPCVGVKLGKSQHRFVHLTETQKSDLIAALMECDNPYFFPLVMTAKETTLRLDSLVNMTWSNTDVAQRCAYLPTKTGMRPYVLSQEVRTILNGLPQSPAELVFPMRKSAVNSMWDRVRIKAGLPKLQFRDLRHLGATDWVRRGLNAHQLMKVLGHDNIQTAQWYIDLVGKDLEDALDEASKKAGVIAMPKEFPQNPKKFLGEKRAARLNKRRAILKPTASIEEEGGDYQDAEQAPASDLIAISSPESTSAIPAVQEDVSASPPAQTAELIYVNFSRKAA